MTLLGKCETCRRRKIKCDEERPRCGSCSKKGRDCRYRNTDESIFVHENLQLAPQTRSQSGSTSSTPIPTRRRSANLDSDSYASVPVLLRLKRTRRAQDGLGKYMTFGTEKSDNAELYSESEARGHDFGQSPTRLGPDPLLLCPQSTLAARWGAVFGFPALELNPLGDWIKSVVSCAGEDACLDCASEYALTSMVAFQQQDPISLNRAYAAGERAIRSLQKAVNNCNDQQAAQYLVLAVMLHYAAEHFMGVGSYYYVLHLLGVAQLLKSAQIDWSGNQLFGKIVGLICEDEVVESIFCGSPSLFEDIPMSPISIGPLHELEVALHAVEHLLVKLPRLVGLVRSALQSRDAVEERTQAISIANEIFNSDIDLYVQETLRIQSTTVQSPETVRTSPTGNTFSFKCPSAFVLAIRFYFYRAIICGLIQALNTLDDNSFFDLESVESQDVAAATSIAMCLDYALQPSPSRPFTALAMIIPIKYGHGAWIRLQQKYPRGSAEHEQATRMRAWSVDTAEYLKHMWSEPAVNNLDLGLVCEMFAGGPLPEWMFDYKRNEIRSAWGLDRERSPRQSSA